MDSTLFSNCLPGMEKELLVEIDEHASVQRFSSGDFVVKEGQYIRFLPIILKGTVRVFSTEDALEFLLYYISSGDACVFSFAHIYSEMPAEFSALAEVDSELLLLPLSKVNGWLSRYPSFSNLILKGYQKHYKELLDTTKQITCYNLEDRIVAYLQNKKKIINSDVLKVSHQEIADAMGTSREVVSRLMRKIGADGKILQQGRSIKVL